MSRVSKSWFRFENEIHTYHQEDTHEGRIWDNGLLDTMLCCVDLGLIYQVSRHDYVVSNQTIFIFWITFDSEEQKELFAKTKFNKINKNQERYEITSRH